MKKDIHPKYQQVLFVDTTTGVKFVCGSTVQSKKTEKFEGVEYPVSLLSISSYSHPFFTGSNQMLDAEGRVEKFRNRYAAAQQKSKEEKEKKDSQKEKEKEEKTKPAKKSPKKA